jgi:hypothetical protein
LGKLLKNSLITDFTRRQHWLFKLAKIAALNEVSPIKLAFTSIKDKRIKTKEPVIPQANFYY